MKAIVVSDLHLGSTHFLSREFENLLRSLPKGFDLVLNGDVLDDCKNSLNPSHQQVLELVRLESYHRRVIWVRGNHDESCPMSKLGEISFKSEHAYDTQLLIIHGHKIDNVRKIVRGFLRIRDFIASIGRNRINLEICVTKIRPLYKWYRSYLMRRAMSYARKKGFRTIACGHTHYPEDKITDGIRYINTGAWTKWPPFYLLVNNGEMSLRVLRR
ncbi:MAG: metallophosphoesterase family protein [Deltaproteobacteria bacterium]|nr:MAG: metallophosphoesterase family protein [Deltaproteobacteria bacterium]